jgi:2,5-diamino-6-(ribosylamino)-4(3H)-pyrimidinone 5'-phosphate reductase
MYVIINAAMSIDGKIATVTGDSKISSLTDRLRVHRLRSSVDAIMVGISTVMKDDPMLTARLTKSRNKNPVRIIIDSKAKIPINSRIMNTSRSITTILGVSNRAPKKRISEIQKRNVIVIKAGNNMVDLGHIFQILVKMGFNRILVEGGGELNWSVLNLSIAKELIVTISSKIVGGRNAKTLVEGKGISRIKDGINLRLQNALYNENEIILYYKLAED